VEDCCLKIVRFRSICLIVRREEGGVAEACVEAGGNVRGIGQTAPAAVSGRER
jgi:hypothetical protein